MKRILCLAVLACVSASRAQATIVTLKPYNGVGVTLAAVYDTELSNYGTENLYNYGGKSSYTDLFQTARVYLVRFDLSAIPNLSQVTAVNAATLRIYRLGYSFHNDNLQVGQLAQGWVQGTGDGGWAGACDGAQWFARNAGTTVPKGSLVSDGNGIYHLNGVTNLANDPVNTGGYFVRMAGSPGNYNNAGQGGLYTVYTSLAALTAAGGTRGCFWDSVNSRLYVNKNDSDVRWYSSSDLWDTPGAPVTGSYVNDNAYPTAPTVPGWVGFNISAIAQNWITGGQANYGVRMMQPANCQNDVASSRYTTDPTLTPELVLDLQYGPPPTQPAIKLGSRHTELQRPCRRPVAGDTRRPGAEHRDRHAALDRSRAHPGPRLDLAGQRERDGQRLVQRGRQLAGHVRRYVHGLCGCDRCECLQLTADRNRYAAGPAAASARDYARPRYAEFHRPCRGSNPSRTGRAGAE